MAALEVETSLAEGELEGLGLGRYNEFSLVELYLCSPLFICSARRYIWMIYLSATCVLHVQRFDALPIKSAALAHH